MQKDVLHLQYVNKKIEKNQPQQKPKLCAVKSEWV